MIRAALKQLLRLVLPPIAGIVVAAGLFLLMQYLITIADREPSEESVRHSVELVEIQEQEQVEPEQQDQPQEVSEALEAASNVPASIPSMSTPSPAGIPVGSGDLAIGDIEVGFEFDAGLGGGLGGAVGALGAGLDGSGGGKPFSGRPLTPVSTGRPQCPTYAVDNQIEGWVDVLFIVDKRGQVRNPRILNASPKGIFEASAVEAVNTWQYSPSDLGGSAHEVKQRIEFRLSECAMDWRTRR